MGYDVLAPLLCGCGCGLHAATDQRRSRVSKFRAGHNSRSEPPMRGRSHTDAARGKIRAARATQVNVVGGGPEVRDPDARFDRHVYYEPNTGCHLWGGACTTTGYGAFGIGSTRDGTARVVRSHRFAYVRAIGPIPDGLELDHLCSTPSCVNPAHLEPVTHAENMRRAVARRKTKEKEL